MTYIHSRRCQGSGTRDVVSGRCDQLKYSYLEVHLSETGARFHSLKGSHDRVYLHHVYLYHSGAVCKKWLVRHGKGPRKLQGKIHHGLSFLLHHENFPIISPEYTPYPIQKPGAFLVPQIYTLNLCENSTFLTRCLFSEMVSLNLVYLPRIPVMTYPSSRHRGNGSRACL